MSRGTSNDAKVHAQALAKIERGHTQDLQDVEAMQRLELIEAGRLSNLFDAVEPDLARYPALDSAGPARGGPGGGRDCRPPEARFQC